MAVFVVWLCFLFFYWGPILDEFYVKGTFLESFWRARPINLRFGAVEKLEKAEKKKQDRKDRAIKFEMRYKKKLLHRSTAKVEPVDLNGLATDRPFLMSAQSGEVLYSDEENRRDSIPASSEYIRSSVGHHDDQSPYKENTLELLPD